MIDFIIEIVKGSNEICLPQVAHIAIQTDEIKMKKNDSATQTEISPKNLTSQVDFQKIKPLNNRSSHRKSKLGCVVRMDVDSIV